MTKRLSEMTQIEITQAEIATMAARALEAKRAGHDELRRLYLKRAADLKQRLAWQKLAAAERACDHCRQPFVPTEIEPTTCASALTTTDQLASQVEAWRA